MTTKKVSVAVAQTFLYELLASRAGNQNQTLAKFCFVNAKLALDVKALSIVSVALVVAVHSFLINRKLLCNP